MEKISAIVPVYNLAAYLERCVKSICAQSYRNLEIILVDDGSSDNSFEVIGRLAQNDDRIVPLRKENGGVTSARLEGLKHATGEWISFIDGDDEIESVMYERLLNNAHKYNADISHCGYKMVFPSRVDFYYNTGKIVVQDNESGLKDLLEATFVEPALVNKLYKRELLLEVPQIMDLSIRENEDLLMNYYIFKMAKCAVFEDICPYHYLVRKGSATTGMFSAQKQHDGLKVLHLIESENDPRLATILTSRIASKLIKLSELDDSVEGYAELRLQSRRELRDRLPVIRRLCSKRTKLEACLASYLPWLYRFIHKSYSCLKGTSKKFEVE